MTESMLENWIETVCKAAGWSHPYQHINGAYRFRLQDDVNVDVSSSDHREILLEADIVHIPETSEADMLEKAARAVLPRVFKDSGIVCYHGDSGSLVLQQNVIAGTLRHSQFAGVMEHFLNDLYFYKSLFSGSLI